MFSFRSIIFISVSLFIYNKATAFNIETTSNQKIQLTDNYYFKLPLIFKLNDPKVSHLYNDGFTYVEFYITDTLYVEYRKNMESCNTIFNDLFKKVETCWLTNDEFKIEGLNNHVYLLKESRVYLDELDDCLFLLELAINLSELGTALIAIKVTGYDPRFETFERRVKSARDLLKTINYFPSE